MWGSSSGGLLPFTASPGEPVEVWENEAGNVGFSRRVMDDEGQSEEPPSCGPRVSR